MQDALQYLERVREGGAKDISQTRVDMLGAVVADLTAIGACCVAV